jgi:hypothetical protein
MIRDLRAIISAAWLLRADRQCTMAYKAKHLAPYIAEPSRDILAFYDLRFVA